MTLLALAGAIGGFINGFFGTGGGIIMFVFLSRLGCDTRRALATANVVMLVLSLSSFFLYLKNGTVSRQVLMPFLKSDLPLALVFGGVGALLSDKVSAKFLKRLFSFLVILAGVRMVFA